MISLEYVTIFTLHPSPPQKQTFVDVEATGNSPVELFV